MPRFFSSITCLKLFVLGCTLFVSAASPSCGSEYGQQVLSTRWAKQVTATSAWPEYPRPQMVRPLWLNLNGQWDLAITGKQEAPPESFPEKILVPFPLESYLGGVTRTLSPSHRAWYRRSFVVDPAWGTQRVLLHFGAVDWQTSVWVNGDEVGQHRGGYDPFEFDITSHLRSGEENVIVVEVSDPTDSGSQPRGKQKRSPEGIWYTPVSGIWQTVWLEPVPNSWIENLRVTPDVDASTVTVGVAVKDAPENSKVEVEVQNGQTVVSSTQIPVGEPAVLTIDSPQLWSPENPFLYDLKVTLTHNSETLDQVTSYLGMRSIELGKDRNNQTRMLLNNKPIFQFGPLDQGYWPDGLYTAPSDEALRYDLEVIKRLGFNMVRKHVKVEPARWYYWCDRLGLLVWQDIPNGGTNAPWPEDGTEITRSAKSACQFRRELQRIVDARRHFPSVVTWILFNEGWGQFKTEELTDWLKTYDRSRLVVSASGGNDFGCGDANDDHFYPGPGCPPAECHRASVLGEFGGFGFPIIGHTWHGERSWGYRSFQTLEEYTSAYIDALEKLRPLVESHLSGAVYTQLTDVELEVNGLMTADREVVKPDEASVRSINRALLEPLPALAEEQSVAGSVLAWWRFEEGRPGKLVSDLTQRMGAIAARDFSDHNNHLYAFSPQNAPASSASVPLRAVTFLESVNNQCLDDTARPNGGALTRDLFTDPALSRTHMDTLDRFPFTQWTIEASFRPKEAAGGHVILAKEESRDGTLSPLLQLGLWGDPPTVGIEFTDGTGQKVFVDSNRPTDPAEWTHVAATCDGSTARLYLARDSDSMPYKLVGKAHVEGALMRRRGTWLVGRGNDSGRMGQDFIGWIDEVRISTKALKKSQFLFGNADGGEVLK